MLPQFKKIFGEVCTVKYYLKSIRKVEEKISEPVFFVFSDDIDWVKQNFTFNKVYFVDWNKGQNSFWDMYLMSQCSANIIANSTFSFWGAYLNKNNPFVIYPQKWVRTNLKQPNIFPKNGWPYNKRKDAVEKIFLFIVLFFLLYLHCNLGFFGILKLGYFMLLFF